MRPIISAFLLVLGTLFCLPSLAAKKRCPRALSIVSEDEPFGISWDRPERLLSNFAPFSRILTLADGETIDDSRAIARAYPKAYVIGSDVEAILPTEESAPSYQADIRQLRNLTVMQIDVNFPIGLPDGAVELVYLYAGLCHCKDRRRSCCGVPLDEKAIERFLREVWRLIDKTVPHSMAVLHGYLPEPFGSRWSKVCTSLETELALQCIPQMGPRAALWGFNLKQQSKPARP